MLQLLLLVLVLLCRRLLVDVHSSQQVDMLQEVGPSRRCGSSR
jgi:hypothetical protein